MVDGFCFFNFFVLQKLCLCVGEIVVDLFVGGGGVSEGFKQVLGIDFVFVYNYDELVIGMYVVNYLFIIYYCEDIWYVDLCVDVVGCFVGWFYVLFDCMYFSQVKGGQLCSMKMCVLFWVVLKWVGQLLCVDCDVGLNIVLCIFLMENVWQILIWGLLIVKCCKFIGCVLRMDGIVVVCGEYVLVEQQQLVFDKWYSGWIWWQFVVVL